MIDFCRLIASDTHGVVNIWDRRVGVLPSLELSTGSHSTLNSLQLHAENQVNLLNRNILLFIVNFTCLFLKKCANF